MYSMAYHVGSNILVDQKWWSSTKNHNMNPEREFCSFGQNYAMVKAVLLNNIPGV